MITVFFSIGSLGLHEGIARTVSFRSSKYPKEYKEKIFSSLILLASLSGGLCFLLLRGLSPYISAFFQKDITWIIQVVSISIPFSLLLEFLISYFRGFEKAEVKVIFNDVCKNALFLSILVAILVKNMPFPTVVMGYILAIIVSAIFLLFYTFKKIGAPQVRKIIPVTEEMLVFSLPLMAGSLFQLITGWADTLLLGVLRTAEEIALYNAALPTSKLVQTVMAAFLFLYIPVATSLVSKRMMSEMNQVYAVVSKWIVSLNFPLFMVLFLYADTLFLFLYGHAYLPAVLPFRTIAVGYFLRDFFGPNGGALIALGKTKTIMVIVSLTALTNLGFNLVLIPRMGIEGAAISMLATLLTASALKGSILYKISGIHPLRWNFVKPVGFSLVLIGGFQIVLEHVIPIKAWMLPFFLIGFMLIHGFSLVVTKSLDQEDIWMLLLLERRLGLSLTLFKKIMKRFLR